MAIYLAATCVSGMKSRFVRWSSDTGGWFGRCADISRVATKVGLQSLKLVVDEKAHSLFITGDDKSVTWAKNLIIILSGKSETPKPEAAANLYALSGDFGFRTSDFLRVSDSRFRPWGAYQIERPRTA